MCGCLKKISIFENAFDNKGSIMNLDAVLFTAKWKDKVLEYRGISNAEKRKNAKLQMPMFTVSGVFDTRSRCGLLEHSGMICLDVDGKDNPELNISDFIKSMKYIDEVYYAGYSIGGKGCFVIIPISEPDKHGLHFDALSRDFERMGVKIDKACRDVSRARFVSFDDSPYYNPNAKTYDKIFSPKPVQQVKFLNPQTNIERLAQKVIESGINITKSYKDWFALACSLRGVENGRRIFHSLSAMDGRYNEAQAEYQFDAVDAGGGYDERKFFEICKRHGIYLR